MRCAEHVAHMGIRNACITLVGKPEARRAILDKSK
jgi:hypothetical protein